MAVKKKVAKKATKKKSTKKKTSKKTVKKKTSKALVTKNVPGATPDFIKEHAVKAHEENTLALPSDHLEQLTICVDRMAILKEIHKKNKDTNTRVNAECEKYAKQAMALLVKHNLGEFTGKTHKIKIIVKSNVKVPATDIDKQKLFDWILENKGADILLSYQKIDSGTLNTFFQTESDLYFEETGKTDFSIDGLEPPKAFEKLSFTKNKK